MTRGASKEGWGGSEGKEGFPSFYGIYLLSFPSLPFEKGTFF